MAPLNGTSDNADEAAVHGENIGDGGLGVYGFCATGHGIRGESTSSRGVVGKSETFHGVYGHSKGDAGVVSESDNLHGVWGSGHNASGAGVFGTNDAPGSLGVHGISATGHGVHGDSTSSRGVVGTSQTYQGVYGWSRDNAGVVGESQAGHGVFGSCHNANGAGVYGTNDAPGGLAGVFNGDVAVGGEIRITNLACTTCVMYFDLADGVTADVGTVMVLDADGRLRPCSKADDPHVIGVVAGGKPAIVLNHNPPRNQAPIALLGMTHCKVDPGFTGIHPGDLLTTSETTGHASLAASFHKPAGSRIGKALQYAPSHLGQQFIPILVALQ